MALSDASVRRLKPRERPYKVWDEGGLYVYVSPTGARLWRQRAHLHGREILLSYGEYPAVGLAAARARRDAAVADLAAGLDPRAATRRAAAAGTFRDAARAWLDHLKTTRAVSDDTLEKTRRRLEVWVYPKVGKTPIGAVAETDFKPVLEAIQRAGKGDTIRKVRQAIDRVMRYARAEGWTSVDPSTSMRELATPPDHRRRATILDPKRIGRLLLAMDGYNGHPVVHYALRLSPHLFLRPGELRVGRWDQIDWDEALWRVPGGTMKMRREQLVPLSPYVLELLRELYAITGPSPDVPSRRGWMFPSRINRLDQCMSDNSVRGALRRLGYGPDEITPHGFRHMASTLLNEMKRTRGWHEDAIERQLAHVETNKVRGVYNAAEYLDQRRDIMVAWSTYLLELRQAADDEARARAAKR